MKYATIPGLDRPASRVVLGSIVLLLTATGAIS